MFDLLVCGPVWVDYILYLADPLQTGASGTIEAEVREAGGWGWQVARAIADQGFRVALWSNPVGDDANGRVFSRALAVLPGLEIMTKPRVEMETPYCVTLRTPTSSAFSAATRLWRNQAGTHVPLAMSEALPASRAALFIGTREAGELWLSQWRESRITLAATFNVEEPDDSTGIQDAVQWALRVLGQTSA